MCSRAAPFFRVIEGNIRMELGIFSKTFQRPTLEAALDAVRDSGLTAVQLNLESLGGPSMPDELPADQCQRVCAALAARGIKLAAVSGTFNIIDPNLEQRQRGMERLKVIAAACDRLGTELVTMCTGTCDPEYLWNNHPDNNGPEAWRAMVAAMGEAVEIAEGEDVTLVFEPEVNNVVNSAGKARRLLDEIRSPYLKVVIDGANLFNSGQLPRMREVLEEAFDLLGGDIRLAHAKDLERDGDAGHQAAGTGVLDYRRYLQLLEEVGFSGALILHSLSEEQVPGSAAYVRAKMGRQ